MGGSIKKVQIAHVIVSVAKTLEQKEHNLATIALLKSRIGKDGIVFENCKFDNSLLIIDTESQNTLLGIEEQKVQSRQERAKAALRAKGFTIGSEYRRGDRGYHGANLAIDIPGYQWGGSGAIGQKEYDGSSRVRSVLGLKGGGIIPKQNQRNDLKSLSSYPSYSTEGGFIIAIQPMIIERTVPVSVGNKGGTTAFIPSGSVNNTNIQSLSRG
jgi:hypothetical protein